MTKTFPSGKTAFLVIHGIGEQNPFETLDSFGRGLANCLTTRGTIPELTHELRPRKGATGSPWTESFVRLSPRGSNDYIDVHEYYWAYITEEKIKPSAVMQWLQDALAGAMKYADQNEEMRAKYEKTGKPYWWRLLSMIHWMRYWFWVIRLLLFILPEWSIFNSLRGAIEGLATNIIVGYVGDVAIYTTTDEKSRYYKIRQQILAESIVLLESLLKENEYDQVIVAGHSLGSVIAYDTLNRLNLKSNVDPKETPPLDRLAGLITFGSPLDKTAFFFHVQTEKEQYIRRQIIRHLYSFKAKSLDLQNDEMIVKDEIKPGLDGIRWMNYYNDLDPVSGHLDFYTVAGEDNLKINFGEKTKFGKLWGAAHLSYWDEPKFYSDIVDYMLLKKKRAPGKPGEAPTI